MKNVGRGALERGEPGVKVGDDDLGLMTSKSGEKTFLSQDEILLARIEVASPRSLLYYGEWISEPLYDITAELWIDGNQLKKRRNTVVPFVSGSLQMSLSLRSGKEHLRMSSS